ncbi:hypothetical protein [Nitratireductor pacificus]|uniref:Transmembrane protein n=1 Tax=Nitratireductor pacificus pht-3B TaxID=391937 RepID=K2MTX6_9HYPH|nr:hypothetical protein [Nitratireductor pacificus]EKF20852.1 hypothetical protein NA2_00700 [Nitratireductor pacificus pht-3B]
MTRSFVSVTPQRIVLASCAMLFAFLAIGWMTREDPGEGPLLQVLDGGFVNNFRMTEMHHGFAAAKPLASDSTIEASVERPASSADRGVRGRTRAPDQWKEVVPWSRAADLAGPLGGPVVGSGQESNAANFRNRCTTWSCLGLCIRYPQRCRY